MLKHLKKSKYFIIWDDFQVLLGRCLFSRKFIFCAVTVPDILANVLLSWPSSHRGQTLDFISSILL